MTLSVFELYKIGIGPSSSHTVGPMVAAHRFVSDLKNQGVLGKVNRVETRLYGSLALTGKGHATDTAVIYGLCGELPDSITPERIEQYKHLARIDHQLLLGGEHAIHFDEIRDLRFQVKENLPQHPNGMRFRAFTSDNSACYEGVYFSIGGGFVLSQSEILQSNEDEAPSVAVPYQFTSGDELLEICEAQQLSITDVVRGNELSSMDDAEYCARLDRVWQVMQASVEKGCATEGVLPGGLNVKRRAAQLHQDLLKSSAEGQADPLQVMDWVNLYAMAVNEENAAGGQVVTAPTNGAAGVIPAVGMYFLNFVAGADQAGLRVYLSTAAAIGMLYKRNASISAAEVGCQGEIGVASSMAAAGLAAAMGADSRQVENAAEIAMEHSLGLTCDPVGGLVQVPCIERNTMGAVKAINAARLAMRGTGEHQVSLDAVIETMHQTGKDMQAKYKETSQGGLAVNVVEC